MGTMSTFGTYNMAKLGIYVAQQALTVTGNNITNINTEGYTRQQLDQTNLTLGAADRYQSRFNTSYSAGVMENGVDQLRDPYLDIRYRNEMTEVGGMEAKLTGLQDLKYIMDEVGKGADGEGMLEARFNELVQSLENLHAAGAFKEADETVARSAAKALTDTLNDYATRLEAVREEQELRFEENVDHVNTILSRIRDLSSSIRKSEIYGGVALTQRDERNKLIDELSEYVGIDVTTDMETVANGLEVERLMISTSGEPKRMLIDGVYGAQLAIRDKENYGLDITELKSVKGYSDPRTTNEMVERASRIEAAYAAPTEGTVFTTKGKRTAEMMAKEVAEQMNGDPSFYTNSADDTVNYYFKAQQVDDDGKEWVVARYAVAPADTLDARQSYAVANAVAPDYPVFEHEGHAELNDIELSGGLQAQRELLTESGEYTWADSYDETDLRYDPKSPIKRGIPYYQKALDMLANTFAQIMNEANTMQDADLYRTNADGVLVDAGNKPIYDEDGNRVGDPVPKLGFEDYFVTDEAGNYKVENDRLVVKPEYKSRMGGNLFANSGITDSDTDPQITAANISVALSWADGNMHVLQSKKPDFASGDQDNIAHMIVLMTTDREFVLKESDYPNWRETQRTGMPIFRGTFQEMFTENITGVMADDIKTTDILLGNHQTTANELFVDRDGVMGVDLNDEAMNMMQYSKAYSAACRLMTTFDQMLEKLINGTA